MDASFMAFLADAARALDAAMPEIWRIEADDQTVPSGIEPIDQPPAPGCASCGACCKSFPGSFYPSDLGATQTEREAMARQLLETGAYSIDWWEGATPDRNVYFLRPATIYSRLKIFDPSTGGACALLGPAGCYLPRDARPTVCRALPATPNSKFGCRGLTKRDVRDAWVNDSAWLCRLGERIQEERGGRD